MAAAALTAARQRQGRRSNGWGSLALAAATMAAWPVGPGGGFRGCSRAATTQTIKDKRSDGCAPGVAAPARVRTAPASFQPAAAAAASSALAAGRRDCCDAADTPALTPATPGHRCCRNPAACRPAAGA
ncbi:hypothetical protein TSOC_002587 [Tetrabaena socialis]|uniref:Uncharacterized protein n=1 Tax=Tetrabaena socialis TaxID=47790 RepID=A0A2J8ADQ3_9CHLO|nr:hypothetical protein TSOC_002587 [Tetrabaena socialis]|eukprot:PNH10643.1 hypothetical protein TSOC_002587 [Tetrabaena socialis]